MSIIGLLVSLEAELVRLIDLTGKIDSLLLSVVVSIVLLSSVYLIE
jgi:hypothetical protein